MHNRYFSNITINYDNLSSLPEDDHITNMPSVSVPCGNEEPEMFTNTTEDPDLSRTFVPSLHQNMTEEESVRHSLESGIIPVPWPARGQLPLNEFQCEGYFTCAFPTLFPTGAAEFLAPRLNSVSLGAYFKHIIIKYGST